MWGQFHPIPYRSKIKEKFISLFGISLSISQAIWWAMGGILSFQMSKVIPRIGNDWMYSRVHYFIPFGICVFLCQTKHPSTGLPIWKYYMLTILLRFSKRSYVYDKEKKGV